MRPAGPTSRAADILFVSMLFLEDHIRAVMPALVERREKCDAMLCCMSAGEVVRLTRLGRLDMSAEATGAMALLKRLRGSAGKGGASSGKGQMKMLRRLPKLLRFIPGTAQDLRAYFLGLQYQLAGSQENLANLLRMLVERYAAGPRRPVPGAIHAAPPTQYPDVGLYHPRVPGQIFERAELLPGNGASGTVGLLVLRSYVLAGNAGHYEGVIAALEARGLRVIPAFASGLDQRPAMTQYFFRDGVPAVDAVVSLTGFSLVGGPAYNDARSAEDMLASLDVPYIAAHPLEFQTLQQWRADERGLTPIEATMMVAIPELDGAVCPMTFGGRSDAGNGERRRDMVAHEERAATLAARVARLVALRRSERADRRLAVVLFNFPPNAGATGSAAYLGVFASLFNTLRALHAAGYVVDVPSSVDALRDMILGGNATRYGTEANVMARVPADDHIRREPHLADIERQWGPAPGRAQSDGASIFVLGARFGNVFVGIQPAFGYEGDPMRLLFEHGFAPTHAFSCFYRWLREDFAAHAVLHFGTHGALEFMPGKQAGMSAECWPDRLIGDLPNFNFYASNNPSEGSLAKRRAGATLISYLTPPVTQAGLYRGLLDLKASLDRFRALAPDADERDGLIALVQAQAVAVDLTTAEPVWERADADARDRGAGARDAGTGIRADPAWAACDRRAAARAGARRDAGCGRRDRTGAACATRCAAGDRSRNSVAAARAGCRVSASGAGRRSAAQHRCAADRAQPAWLRSLPHPQRLRGAGRHPSGGPAAGAAYGGCGCAAGDGGDGAVGHRQPEDRRRADRAGALADGRGAAPRQLRAAVRRATAAAGDAGAAAHRRADLAVRHFPRPAAVADETAGRGGTAGRDRRRAGGDEFHPQARAGVAGRTGSADRGSGAAGVRQCGRRLWRERQPDPERRCLERRGRTGRGLCSPQGLCLRRGRQAAPA